MPVDETDPRFDWTFPDLPPRGSGQGGDLTQFAVDGDLETFVREVLQNANDAGVPDSDEPVEVVFRIEELTGETFERFTDAFQWDHWREHVAAAAAGGTTSRSGSTATPVRSKRKRHSVC